MDSATILVLLLCAGVVALLVWFEINSRRNEASKTPESALAQSFGNVTEGKARPRLNLRATKGRLHNTQQSGKARSSS